MDDIISKLKTPQECENLEKNATARGRNDLALAARRRWIELKAMAFGTTDEAARECIEAVYAYERVLSKRNSKTSRASRTWQMIKKYGVLPAVERAVKRPTETSGYRALIDMGLEYYSFEAVVLRHPNAFSKEAVQCSRTRISDLNDAS